MNPLGRKLKRALSSNKVYAYIDAFAETHGGTPLAGACWPVAEALHHLLPGSRLYTVSDAQLNPQHIVVRFRSLFYDADGSSTKTELLARWNEIEGLEQPCVQVLTVARRAQCYGAGMPYPVELVAVLVEYLQRTVGPSDVAEGLGLWQKA